MCPALGSIGPAVQAAIPALTEAAADPDRQVADMAKYALVEIQKTAGR